MLIFPRRSVRLPSLWVYFLIPFGWIPYAIVASLLTEYVPCYTHFCPRHTNHWRIRTLAIWGFFRLIVLGIVAILFISMAVVGSQSAAAQQRVLGSVCWIGTPANDR